MNLKADPGHTNLFFEKSKNIYPNIEPHVRKFRGLSISSIGYGSYRIGNNNPSQYSSLKKAILSGVNLIDTSTNYGNGTSESMIGALIQDLMETNTIHRNSLVVVTKIGYIQGENMNIVEEREKQNNPFTEITFYDEDCYHCISPDFLEDQILRSQKRLNLDTIDVLLLHNPEYFLMDREKHNVPKEKATREYYSRIKNAFLKMEEFRKKGWIQYYGISSNTFPIPKEEYTYTSLSRVIEMAEEVKKELNLEESGFAFIQFPANLYENGFVKNKDESGKNLLEIAKENNLFTLINRPLNAFIKTKGMVRLHKNNKEDKNLIEKEVEDFLSVFKPLENSLLEKARIKIPENTFSSVFTDHIHKFQSMEHLNYSLQNSIIPLLQSNIQKMHMFFPPKDLEPYIDQINKGITLLEKKLGYLLESNLESINAKLILPGINPDSLSFSQKSIFSLLSLPNVGTVLVGMRRDEYVESVTQLFHFQPKSINGETFCAFTME